MSNSSSTNVQTVPVIGQSSSSVEPSQSSQTSLLLETLTNKSSLKLTQFQLGNDGEDSSHQQQERNETNDMMLDLSQPRLSSQQKEVKFFIPDQRLSTGSNMSTSSIESISDNQSHSSYSQFSPILSSNTSGVNLTTNSMLQHGICIKQTLVTVKEIKIASKAIEMITCFMQHRQDCIPHVLNTKMFNECVLDVLTGSVSADIRVYTQKFLYKLSQIETVPFNCPPK